jgi:hypothetical protein
MKKKLITIQINGASAYIPPEDRDAVGPTKV